MIKWIKRILVGLAVIYFVVGFGLYFFQENLIFQSSRLAADYKYEFTYPFEEIRLEGEKASLNGLHFKVKNPKGVIVYYHGNAGDLSRWGDVIKPLLNYNYDIVIMDYRGFGKSTGKRQEDLMYQDADLFYYYAKSKYSEENIIVYGRSLGSTFAMYVAAQNSPRSLILETPFYSLMDVAQSRFPIYPVNVLLDYSFPSYSYIEKVKCSTLILHGIDDYVVPYESAEKLYESFISNVTFISIRDGHHNDLSKFPEYWENVDKVLKN